MEQKPERYAVFKTLERINKIGYCYLLLHPAFHGEITPLILQHFSTDVKFKLQIDGNKLIQMGVPKGKQLAIVKDNLMRACINCDDIDLRNSFDFQQQQAQLITDSLKTQ